MSAFDEQPSILASGEKFAKEAGTTIALEGAKPEGQAAEATVAVESTGSNRWFTWGRGSSASSSRTGQAPA